MKDLIKPIEDMTDEELQDRIRQIRSNRTTIRPAAKDHVKRAAKKGAQKRVSNVEKLLEGLTQEEIFALLGGGNG